MPGLTLDPYDPRWPAHFAKIAGSVESALVGLPTRIEHIGSTAVPGMTAKPIIDLDIVLTSWEMFDDAKARLEGLGYLHEGNLGINEREAFKTPSSTSFPHHLYVCAEDSAELKRHISFRDYLRSHPELVSEYSQLKLELLASTGGDRVKYTDGKASFVGNVLKLAEASRSS